MQRLFSLMAICFLHPTLYFHSFFFYSCSVFTSRTIPPQNCQCVRHLIRLKHNPLSDKQLIWPIIVCYLLTLYSYKIQDFNTQSAWGHCAKGFLCLVMAVKYLMFDPSLAQCSFQYISVILLLIKYNSDKQNTDIMRLFLWGHVSRFILSICNDVWHSADLSILEMLFNWFEIDLRVNYWHPPLMLCDLIGVMWGNTMAFNSKPFQSFVLASSFHFLLGKKNHF